MQRSGAVIKEIHKLWLEWASVDPKLTFRSLSYLIVC